MIWAIAPPRECPVRITDSSMAWFSIKSSLIFSAASLNPLWIFAESFLSLNGKIFKGKDIDINKEYY